MAKEYRMDWELSAKLDGSYKQTFQQAQDALRETQKQIQELQHVQNDITSYQKLQGAVANTSKRLENMTRQYDLLQKEISETEGGTSALEREKLKLEQRINDTGAALDRQRQKLNATDSALQEAGVNISNLTGESARLSAQMGGLRQRQDAAADSAAQFGEQAESAFETVQSAIAAAGVAAGLQQIGEAFMGCVSGAADFEASMSNVHALSGASSRELAQLTEQARLLGAQTKYTALQSADAMGFMGMAGWDAADMLGGMDGVIQLAAASGEDLAMVSDIVTDSLSAFGLKASDAAHFADVLAAAATNSNTNVAIMGETFRQSASVAGALGYSIEDVATAVGLMANSGVKGSIAGTALKNTFNGLLEGATLTSEAFGEYEVSAVKADGTMKTFGETISELRGFFQQMTEAERVNNAVTIAGEYGYNGLLAILNATEEDYRSLTQTINSCSGAAEKMADIKMDNLSGDVTLMKSAWEGFKNTIGGMFIPEMRTAAKATTALIGGADGLAKSFPPLVKGAAAFAGVIGVATAGLTAYAAAVKVVKVLDIAALFAGPAGTALKAAAGVAALAAGIAALTAAAGELGETEFPAFDEMTESARDAGEALGQLRTDCEETYSGLLASASMAEHYVSKLEELERAGLETGEAQQRYHAALTALSEEVPELAGKIDLETDSIEGGTAALRANIAAMRDNAKAKAHQEYLTEIYKRQASVLLEQQKNYIGLAKAEAQADEAQGKYNAAIAEMNELNQDPSASQNAARMQELEESAREYAREMGDAKTAAADYRDAIDEDTAALKDIEDEIALTEEAFGRLNAAQLGGVEYSPEVQAELEGVSAAAASAYKSIQELSDAYEEAYTNAVASVQGQYSLWDEAKTVIPTSIAELNASVESQIKYWQEYEQNLKFLRTKTAEFAGLSDVISLLADGSAESAGAVAGLAAAIKAGNSTEVSALTGKVKTLGEAQQKAADSMAGAATQVDKTMKDTIDKLGDSIEDMDLSEEAAGAAKKTLDAYSKTVEGYSAAIQTSYNSLITSVRAKLNELSGLSAQASSIAASAGGNGYVPTAFLREHAEGGILTAPHIGLVAEAGPEAVIPLSDSRRGRGIELWTEAGRIMGLLEGVPQPRLSAAPDNMAALPEPHVIKADIAPETVSAPEALAQAGGLAPDEARAAGLDVQNIRSIVSISPQLIARASDMYEAGRGYDAAVPAWDGLPDWPFDAEPKPARRPDYAPALSAAVSRQGSAVIAPQINITFQVNGNGGDIADTLRRYAESSEFDERVTDIVSKALEDAARGLFI